MPTARTSATKTKSRVNRQAAKRQQQKSNQMGPSDADPTGDSRLYVNRELSLALSCNDRALALGEDAQFRDLNHGDRATAVMFCMSARLQSGR